MSVRSRCIDGFVTYLLITKVLSQPPFIAVMLWTLVCTAIVLTAIEEGVDGRRWW